MIILFTDRRHSSGVDPLKSIDMVKNAFKHLIIHPVKVGFVSETFFSNFPSSYVYEVTNFLDVLSFEEEIDSIREKVCRSEGNESRHSTD